MKKMPPPPPSRPKPPPTAARPFNPYRERRRPRIRQHLETPLCLRRPEVPVIASYRLMVKVSVRAQRHHSQCDSHAPGSFHRVRDVCRAHPPLHTHPLLNHHRSRLIAPDRNAVFQSEIRQMLEPTRIDSAVLEFVSGEP